MNISLKLLLSILMMTMMQTALAKTTYSSSVQTTVTSGKNNGFDDTYVGIWLSGKASVELTRNSRASFSIKAGGQNHDDSIDDKQFIDVAFIKHFYDTSTQDSSASHYFALDYFYKF